MRHDDERNSSMLQWNTKVTLIVLVAALVALAATVANFTWAAANFTW